MVAYSSPGFGGVRSPWNRGMLFEKFRLVSGAIENNFVEIV